MTDLNENERNRNENGLWWWLGGRVLFDLNGNEREREPKRCERTSEREGGGERGSR